MNIPLRHVPSKSITVQPMSLKPKCKTTYSTPTKKAQHHQAETDIHQILQKYLGSNVDDGSNWTDTGSTQRTITTMFHATVNEEDKQIMVSPYKKLSQEEYFQFIDTFQRVANSSSNNKAQDISDIDDFNHFHICSNQSEDELKLSQSSNIAQNLKDAFDTPPRNISSPQDKSPDFINQIDCKIVNAQLSRDLSIILEAEEIKQDQDGSQNHNQIMINKLNEMLSDINQKLESKDTQQLKKIEQIKAKYEPKVHKPDEFHDFVDPIEQPIFQQPKQSQYLTTKQAPESTDQQQQIQGSEQQKPQQATKLKITAQVGKQITKLLCLSLLLVLITQCYQIFFKN